ncbi:MAG: hypothetical protein PWP65_1559 [Clostridia bacterium]|nr:hypothetical protein [Clostridia bacterium]
MVPGFKTAAAFVGVVIGAGFASGQELMQFFVVLGPRAALSVLMAGFLFALAGSAVVWLSLRWRLSHYGDLILKLLGPTWSLPVELIVSLFLLSGFAIMLAGSGAIGDNYLSFAPGACALVTAAITLFIVVARAEGILNFNTWAVPLILIILLAASFRNLEVQLQGGMGASHESRWLLNSLLYVSYNMIPATVLLVSLPHQVGSIFGAFIGGLVIGFAALFLVLALARLPAGSTTTEVPVLHLLACFGRPGQAVFTLVLWLAVVSTATADLYALTLRWYKNLGLTYNQTAILITLLSFPLSSMGFSRLVKYVYPSFGYLILFFLAIAFLKRLAKLVRGIK